MNQLKDFYANMLNKYSGLAGILSFLTIFLIILFCAWIVNKILKKYIVTIVNKFAVRLGPNIGEILIRYKVFNKLSHIGPGILIYLAINICTSSEHDWTISLVETIQLIAQIYITLTIILFCLSFVDAIFSYFQKLPYFKHHSLKSYAQVIKIILYFVAFILVVSQLLDKSPIAFLTGLGALSAVLMLVFKDTILGFVSNIQVAALDLVRVGDWITIPSAGVDGDVKEVSINTVKIRNFDKTISTVPTYTLINNSVQNWRGMVETDGRRIKRSVNIDIDTIRFCDEETLELLSKEPLLQDFITSKKNEKLTNITLFRAYIENYLRNHPKIHIQA